MSNPLLNLVFAEKTLKGIRRTTMLAIANSIDEKRVYGLYGIDQLASDANVTPRHMRRIRDELADDGFIFVKPGNGRGQLTRYLITFHLSENEVADSLVHYLEMSPFEAESTARSVLEKRGTFLNKGGHFHKKGDKKGDSFERKKATSPDPLKTNTSGAKAPESLPKSAEAKSPPLPTPPPERSAEFSGERPPIQIPQRQASKWDPLIESLAEHLFQATTIIDKKVVYGRAAALIHGDKRRPHQIALAKYETERQGVAELDAERVQHLARDVPLMVQDYTDHNDSDLPLDLTRFMTHWVKFRGRQNEHNQTSSAARQRRTRSVLAEGARNRASEGAIEKAKL